MSFAAPAAGTPAVPVRAQTAPRFARLALAQFVAVLYAYCAAGPFGFEEMVSISGPGLSILFLLAVPWVFSLPVSLATAELATAMPVEGGFYRWTRAAFGDFWGFQCGWWNWTGTFLMNAAYAVAIADYIGNLVPGVSASRHWVLSLLILAVVGYLNIRGTRVVGNVTVMILLFVLVPVAVFTALGFQHAQQNPLAPLVPPGRSWREVFGGGFALALWLYSGYEQLSTMTEEIENPPRNFPLGLAIMVPLAMVTFTLPMVAALAAYGRWEEWQTGHLVVVARALGGEHLATVLFAAAGLSLFLGLQSTLLSGSRLPFTMSEDGFFHSSLARLNPRFKTPVRAILLSTVLCGLLSVLHVTQLVSIYMWLRVATTSLTLLALWQLRRRAPGMPRPFRIPGGRAGLVAVVAIPLLLFAWFLANSDRIALLWGPPALAVGPGAYLLFSGRVRRRSHATGTHHSG